MTAENTNQATDAPDAPVAPEKVGVPLDEAGRVAADAQCRPCGYNLRGLDPSQDCPECGEPIRESLRSDLLRYAAPDWLRRLRRGGNWLIAAVVLGFFGGCLSFNGDLLASGAAGGWQLIVASLWLYGVLHATARDPRLMTATTGRGEAIARGGAGAAFGLNCLGVVLGSLHALGPLPLVALGSSAAGSVSVMGLLLVGRGLFRRVPDLASANTARTVAWGYGVCIAIFLLLQLVGELTSGMLPASSNAPPNVSAPSLDIALTGMGLLAIVGWFAFTLWALVLLLRLHRAVARALEQSRQRIEQEWQAMRATSDG